MPQVLSPETHLSCACLIFHRQQAEALVPALYHPLGMSSVQLDPCINSKKQARKAVSLSFTAEKATSSTHI